MAGRLDSAVPGTEFQISGKLRAQVMGQPPLPTGWQGRHNSRFKDTLDDPPPAPTITIEGVEDCPQS